MTRRLKTALPVDHENADALEVFANFCYISTGILLNISLIFHETSLE